jgi:hypothetical protein
MLNHDLEGVGTSLFAEFRPGGNIASGQALKDCADIDEDVARANDDAAHNAQIPHDAKVWQLKGGRHHVMRDGVTRRADFVGREPSDWSIIHQ